MCGCRWVVVSFVSVVVGIFLYFLLESATEEDWQHWLRLQGRDADSSLTAGFIPTSVKALLRKEGLGEALWKAFVVKFAPQWFVLYIWKHVLPSCISSGGTQIIGDSYYDHKSRRTLPRRADIDGYGGGFDACNMEHRRHSLCPAEWRTDGDRLLLEMPLPSQQHGSVAEDALVEFGLQLVEDCYPIFDGGEWPYYTSSVEQCWLGDARDEKWLAACEKRSVQFYIQWLVLARGRVARAINSATNENVVNIISREVHSIASFSLFPAGVVGSLRRFDFNTNAKHPMFHDLAATRLLRGITNCHGVALLLSHLTAELNLPNDVQIRSTFSSVGNQGHWFASLRVVSFRGDSDGENGNDGDGGDDDVVHLDPYSNVCPWRRPMKEKGGGAVEAGGIFGTFNRSRVSFLHHSGAARVDEHAEGHGRVQFEPIPRSVPFFQHDEQTAKAALHANDPFEQSLSSASTQRRHRRPAGTMCMDSIRWFQWLGLYLLPPIAELEECRVGCEGKGQTQQEEDAKMARLWRRYLRLRVRGLVLQVLAEEAERRKRASHLRREWEALAGDTCHYHSGSRDTQLGRRVWNVMEGLCEAATFTIGALEDGAYLC